MAQLRRLTQIHGAMNSRSKRLASVAVPAITITTGLFFAMQHLIKVDDFSTPDLPSYEISAILEKPIIEEPRPATIKPKRPDAIDPPPSNPPLVNEVTTPDGDFGDYFGEPPANYDMGKMDSILPKRVSAITARTLQPITPPVPIYPDKAAVRGLEGFCDVHLSVSIRGEPMNVRAKCSDRVFQNAAERAVKKVKFAPQIRDGLPVTVTGVVYPLEFRLKQ
jgi:protein TonB